MQQLLKPGETSAFQLGKSDYVLVQNCIVIDGNGVATVVTVQQQLGPFAGGANLRAIGSAGGGSIDITDLSIDDRAFVSRDSTGAINGLMDPRSGATVPFGGSDPVARAAAAAASTLAATKLSDPGVAVAASASVAVTALLLNLRNTSNLAGTVTYNFGNLAGTVGLKEADFFYVMNAGPGTVVFAGNISAATGKTLTVPPGCDGAAFYDATSDKFLCLTSSIGALPFSISAVHIPAAALNTFVATLSRAAYGGALPAPTSFVATVDGTARTTTALTLTTPTTLSGTFSGASALASGTDTLAYTEGAARLMSLAGDAALQPFSTMAIIDDAVATAPGQVTGLTAGVATSATQPLTWAAPVSNGASALTDYFIEYKATASPTWLAFAHAASTITGLVITGLTSNTSYDFRVSAVNAIGTGAPSTVATSTTAFAAPVFTSQVPPNALINTPYSYQFAATGAVSYAVASGTLPAGLTLNTATGVLSGTPTTAATSTFTISATNSGGTTLGATQNLVVTTVGFADNFNRADGAPGSNYYSISGTLQVVSNALARTSPMATNLETLHPFTSNDADFTITLTSDGVVASMDAGIAFRVSTTQGRSVGFNFGYYGGSLYLTDRQFNTDIGGGAKPTAAVQGVPIALRVRCVGSSIICYEGGVEKFNITNTGHTTQNNFGVWASTGEMHFDDLTIV